MERYEILYHKLFSAMADAVDALDEMDFGRAKRILIDAQQAAEEEIISAEE